MTKLQKLEAAARKWAEADDLCTKAAHAATAMGDRYTASATGAFGDYKQAVDERALATSLLHSICREFLT